MKPIVDELDKGIVRLLMKDGRMSSAEIARSLGHATARTVSNRIRKLTKEGIIKVAPIVNPRALGYTIVADVFIQTEPGKVEQVAETLAEVDTVNYVAIVSADRDVSIQVNAADVQELRRFITKTLQTIPGVERTNTYLLMEVLKDIDSWGIPAEPPCDRST